MCTRCRLITLDGTPVTEGGCSIECSRGANDIDSGTPDGSQRVESVGERCEGGKTGKEFYLSSMSCKSPKKWSDGRTGAGMIANVGSC